MSIDNVTALGAGDKPHSVQALNHAAHSPLPFPRLYRAHIGADDRNPERTGFVEAASHGDAIRKIANAIAAFECCLPDRVVERIYNVTSARELIEEGLSEDISLRLFETGWCGGEGPSHSYVSRCSCLPRQRR